MGKTDFKFDDYTVWAGCSSSPMFEPMPMSATGGKRTLAAHAHWPLFPDARLRPAPFADPFKPGVEPAQIMGKRLPHVTELIDVAVEADVGDGEPLPRKPRLVHGAVEPPHAGP